VFEKKPCDDKEELLKLFVNKEQRIEVLINLTLFICTCLILDVDFEKNTIDENEWELIIEEMKCFKKDAKKFNDRERKILLKHHLQVHCRVCWLDVCTTSRYISPLIESRPGVIRYVMDLIKDAVKSLIKSKTPESNMSEKPK
jgi:hypothetical protein